MNRSRSSSPHRALAIRALALVVGALLSLSACSASDYARFADRHVAEVLDDRMHEVRERRENEVVYPGTDDSSTSTGAGATAVDPDAPPLQLGLAECLTIATQTNRDFMTQREQLFLQTLSLLGSRHIYNPRLAASLSYLLADGEGLNRADTAGLNASVTKILPTGADVRLSYAASYADIDDGLPMGVSYGSGLTLSLDQPLLRGAGRLVALEPLRQAERNLYYEVRDFELFRQDFAVDVASRYYALVQQMREIENTARNYESFEFDRKQAEALFRVGRQPELNVLRSKRSELNAYNALLAARESFGLALDRFKVFLGLPVATPVEIVPQAPEFVPLHYNVDSAIDVAFVNRLDYLNRQEQLQDAERAVRISANALLPDLDLSLSYALDAATSDDFGDRAPDLDSYDVGVTFGLPLDRRFQRNDYRASQITLTRAKRGLELFEENLRIDIRQAFRELARREQSQQIQAELIVDQERNVSIAQLRFERGEIPNRDVVEARQSLLDAQNSLIEEQVNYEIARLQLLRDLGVLFIDEKGIWTE